jgi:hypothetical protein
MNGTKLGSRTTAILAAWQAALIVRSTHSDLSCAEILETSGKALPNSTTNSPAGLAHVAESFGSLDRAGRHISLLSVNCARIGEMETTSALGREATE